MTIVLEKYQLENLILSNELRGLIFPLLSKEAKEYAREFLRIRLNEKRKYRYYLLMEKYILIFGDKENEK